MLKSTNIVSLFFVFVIILTAATISVSAQMEPKATFPVSGSTVTDEIEMVRVEFNELIDPMISGLELRKGDSQVWIAGVGAGFCDTNSCQLLLGQLEPDTYTVAYDVFTPSGKVIKSQFRFSVIASTPTGN